MDDDQRAGHAGVGQILVVLRHLVGEQQSLVDDRVAGQARDVEILPPFDGGLADSLFDALADDVELALELRLVQDVAGDEDLADGRFRAARLRADRVALDRHVPPAEEPGALLRDHLLDEQLALLARGGGGRQEDHADAVLAGIRQFHVSIGRGAPEELVRDLEQNAGPVAGTGIAALRTTVVQIIENLQSLLNDAVGLVAFDVDHEPDPAAVFLEPRIVEPLFRRKSRDVHLNSRGLCCACERWAEMPTITMS